jgi:hypothetical protein
MSDEYLRDDDRRRIVVTLRGEVTPDEINAVINRQADEGTWNYGLLFNSLHLLTNPTP